MSELIHIPSAKLAEVTRTLLIREWWYIYRLVLEQPAAITPHHKRLAELTDECMKLGIIKPGCPMPRDEAEDLARDVDEFKRRPTKW